jgi:hypothetical protein
MQRSNGKKQHTIAVRQNNNTVLLMSLYFIFARTWFQSADPAHIKSIEVLCLRYVFKRQLTKNMSMAQISQVGATQVPFMFC